MSKVRSKFRCMEKRTVFGQTGAWYKFSAVYDDGIPENQRYCKYTPSGTLELLVDNPNVAYEVGTFYYLDTVEAAE